MDGRARAGLPRSPEIALHRDMQHLAHVPLVSWTSQQCDFVETEIEQLRFALSRRLAALHKLMERHEAARAFCGHWRMRNNVPMLKNILSYIMIVHRRSGYPTHPHYSLRMSVPTQLPYFLIPQTTEANDWLLLARRRSLFRERAFLCADLNAVSQYCQILERVWQVMERHLGAISTSGNVTFV